MLATHQGAAVERPISIETVLCNDPVFFKDWSDIPYMACGEDRDWATIPDMARRQDRPRMEVK